MTAAEPKRPGWGWAFVAALSPLWFLWRRRYVEFVLIWALLLLFHWRAIMASDGYVQMDALWLALVGLVFLPFAIPAGPVLSPGSGGGFLLVMMVVLPAWGLFVATRANARRRTWLSRALCAGAFAVGFLAFGRLHIPGLKYKAYVGGMRRDLLDLALMMDAFYADHGTFVVARDSLPRAQQSGVTMRVIAATDSGWWALAEHNATTSWRCGIYGGRGRLPWAGAVPNEPLCVRMQDVPLRRAGLDELVLDDFERLVAAQDSFRAARGRYAPSLDSLGFERRGGIPLSMRGTATGWTAEAMVHAHFNRQCVIAGGDARNRLRPGAPAGRMVCKRM